MSGPFSAQVPALLEKHLDHLLASAISPAVIGERGYRSLLGKHDLKQLGFSKAQQRCPGILMPLHSVDGAVIKPQYRPDTPRTSTKGKPVKYENPVGSSVRLDVPPRCRKHLGDPSVPLWFTEGVKKADALASAGAGAVGLTGVWGFKGRNLLGGTTILADFDYITLKGRVVYLCFDSDSRTNPKVGSALARLKEHLERKGASVYVVQLPEGAGGEKVGADDYLAQGHTLEEMVRLAVIREVVDRPTLRARSSDLYCVEGGKLCWVKQSQDGEAIVPLCSFDARVTEEIHRDNGIEVSGCFKVVGTDAEGKPLPPTEVPLSTFETMNWVVPAWGLKGVLSANQSARQKLREAIMLQSQEASRRIVYAHTGWREIGDRRVFLTAAGALGEPDIDVELEDDLRSYYLPEPEGDLTASLRASLEFLDMGKAEVMYPLWSAMYVAPLADILPLTFTLFLVGPSGTFKSTITAIALNHYGQRFDEFHLPAAWRDTENKLEKLLFLAKDLPLVIDDWAPGSDSAKARELEVKAEHVIRAQGNRQGRGRLKSDTSSRKTYVPRGLLITSGEQLPGGHSHTARIFSVELQPGDVPRDRITEAQQKKHLYCFAMSAYIAFLQRNWEEMRRLLPEQYLAWRDQAREAGQHPRLPGAVASLYAGLCAGLDFMAEQGVIGKEGVEAIRQKGWRVFLDLSAEQAVRVEEQRPGKRFVEALGSLLDQGRAVLWPREDELPRTPPPGQVAVGWTDGDGHILLNPEAAYAAVRQFCQHTDFPFTFKQNAVWKDLRQLDYLDRANGRSSTTARIYGQVRRVLLLKRSALEAAEDRQEGHKHDN